MGFFKSLGNSITDGLKFDFKGSLGSFDEAFGSPLDKLGGGLKDALGDAWKEFTGEAAQERLMKLQNQYNVDNWKMQNEYNTPAAQMLRYAEAGLNPNLIYGQSNLAGSVGSVSHGAVKSGMDMVGTVLSMLTGMQDLKNMKAQQSLTTQQAEFTKEQTRRYAHDTDWLESNGLSSFSPVLEKNYEFGNRLFNSSRDFFENVVDMLFGSSLQESKDTIRAYQRQGEANAKWLRDYYRDGYLNAR